MKLFSLMMMMGLGAGCFAADAANPNLASIKTVYLLPMSSGLDQFLAIRLTRGAVVQVVTDPQKADAVLSDRIGTGLDEQLEEAFGEKKAQSKDSTGSVTFARPLQGSSRSKGAVFLIDRKTHNVLWSDYEQPKSSQPGDLRHVANKLATALGKEKLGKKTAD